MHINAIVREDGLFRYLYVGWSFIEALEQCEFVRHILNDSAIGFQNYQKKIQIDFEFFLYVPANDCFRISSNVFPGRRPSHRSSSHELVLRLHRTGHDGDGEGIGQGQRGQLYMIILAILGS